jgi:hypothetical protein
LTLIAISVFGCGGSQEAKSADGKRRLEIVHEPCAIESGKTVDVNGDGKPDLWRVMSGNREVCKAIDPNFDGVKDAYIYFDESGKIRRREADFDRDGIPDEVAVFDNGVIVSKELETNFDSKLDTWETYAGGRLAKTERDSDGDGIIDEWWEFNRPEDPSCAIVVRDRNADGKPDPNSEVDLCGEGYKPPSAADVASAAASGPPASTVQGPPTAAASASAAPTATAAASASAAPSASPPKPSPPDKKGSP